MGELKDQTGTQYIENVRSRQIRTKSGIPKLSDEDMPKAIAVLLGVKHFGGKPYDKAFEEKVAGMEPMQRYSEAGALIALLIDNLTGSDGIVRPPRENTANV